MGVKSNGKAAIILESHESRNRRSRGAPTRNGARSIRRRICRVPVSHSKNWIDAKRTASSRTQPPQRRPGRTAPNPRTCPPVRERPSLPEAAVTLTRPSAETSRAFLTSPFRPKIPGRELWKEASRRTLFTHSGSATRSVSELIRGMYAYRIRWKVDRGVRATTQPGHSGEGRRGGSSAR